MKERSQPETLRLRAVMPALTVADVAASLAWYRDVLGCIVNEEFHREDQLVGVSLRAGMVDLLLTQDDWVKGRDRQKGEGIRLYCVTAQDLDQVADDIRSRGGELVQEPTDQPWGARDFALIDPDGFKITITTPVVH